MTQLVKIIDNSIECVEDHQYIKIPIEWFIVVPLVVITADDGALILPVVALIPRLLPLLLDGCVGDNS